MRNNPHIGSSFESWLDEQGIREEVTAAAIRGVIAMQFVAEMKRKRITKSRMAEIMKNGSATLETLIRAVKTVGRELRLELV
jgi:antitoxin HicB